ncbi:MAG: nitroreductase family protein [Candidatus Anstonellales archaeon]
MLILNRDDSERERDMDVKEAILGRRSIRAYLNKKIDRKIIDELVDAMRFAPSSGNLESRNFYFVTNEALRKKIALCCGEMQEEFISSAPLIVVACADRRIEKKYGKRGVELYSIMDVAASVENLHIRAYSLGLGTVWVGAFDEEEVREVLSIPPHLRPITIVPVGYPAEKPEVPPKKVLDEVFTFLE